MICLGGRAFAWEIEKENGGKWGYVGDALTKHFNQLKAKNTKYLKNHEKLKLMVITLITFK